MSIAANTNFAATLTITRPANSTTYSATDAVGGTGGAVLTVANFGPPNAHVFITDWNFQMNIASAPANLSTFRAHIYDASPDAIADNAAWDLSSANDRARFQGYVDINTPTDLGSTLYSQNGSVNKKIVLDSTGSFYVTHVTNGAFAPGSGDVYVATIQGVPAV